MEQSMWQQIFITKSRAWNWFELYVIAVRACATQHRTQYYKLLQHPFSFIFLVVLFSFLLYSRSHLFKTSPFTYASIHIIVTFILDISTLVSIDNHQRDVKRSTSSSLSTSTRTHHPNITCNGCDLSDAGIFMCHSLFFFFSSLFSVMCAYDDCRLQLYFDFLVLFILRLHFSHSIILYILRQIDPSFHPLNRSSPVIWTQFHFAMPAFIIAFTYASYSL